MRLRSKILVSLLFWGTISNAQQTIQSFGKEHYDYVNAVQLWKSGSNPARLSLDTVQNRAMHYFSISRNEATYYLVQNGDAENKLQFCSESYKKIGHYLYSYGKFSFNMGREFNRAWSDVFRGHNSNPYFSGSSIKGKYAFQNFDLSASLATIPLHNFTYGLHFAYKVGDLSRLKDPRSRSNLADYHIQPAVTYSLGRNSVGLSVFYRRRKEKIPNIQKVQEDTHFKYYTFTGVENAFGVTDGYGGFSRQFAHHIWGGELSYGIKKKNFHSLTTFLFSAGKEDVLGKIKYSPGKYSTTDLSVESKNLLYKGNKLHLLVCSGKYSRGRADEYKQTEIKETNSTNGITYTYWKTILVFPKRYRVNIVEFTAHYRINFTNSRNKEILSYVGVIGNYKDVENKHILPISSLKYSFGNIAMEGGFNFLKKNSHSLWFEGQVNYQSSLTSSLNLSKSDSKYSLNVLIPDMKYYEASFIKGNLSITYQMPLKIKELNTYAFVKLSGDYLGTDKDTDAKSLLLSVGIRY